MQPTKQSVPTIASNMSGAQTINEVVMTSPGLPILLPCPQRRFRRLHRSGAVQVMGGDDIGRERRAVEGDVLDGADERKQRACRVGPGWLGPPRDVGSARAD